MGSGGEGGGDPGPGVGLGVEGGDGGDGGSAAFGVAAFSRRIKPSPNAAAVPATPMTYLMTRFSTRSTLVYT